MLVEVAGLGINYEAENHSDEEMSIEVHLESGHEVFRKLRM